MEPLDNYALSGDLTSHEFWSRLRRTRNSALGADRALPRQWRQDRCFVVFKSGDASDVDSWRPIIIESCFLRLYSSMRRYRLADWPRSSVIVSADVQKGFDRVRAAAMLHIGWLDVRDAFGSVPHDLLTRILKETGLLEQAQGVFRDMYENASFAVDTEGASTGEIPLKAGVKQGDPCSSLLVNMLMDPLIRANLDKEDRQRFSYYGQRFSILAYADVLALFSRSARDLAEMLSAVEEVVTQLGLQFNAQKCKYL
ncbi:unnamed protein product [Soboliphyme baturini]|uniref:Reverse transcriptase domain-containing protein n=1 Tax=Soboliphyme baturini TaxID=241478 RepID=A0A183JAH0_9BILA|nr:unnamed protein product [Soboliphyme baturini]